MKIYPINNFKIIKQNFSDKSSKNTYPGGLHENNETLPSSFYHPVFKGKAPDFVSKLALLEDIHCPVCGVKMLNEKKYQELLQLAGAAQNLKEYNAVLNKAKDYLPFYLVKSLRFVDKIVKRSPDLNISDFAKILNKGTKTLFLKELGHSVNSIKRFERENVISERDKEKLNLCKEKLNSYALDKIPKYNELKSILKETFGSLESSNRWPLYSKIKENFINIYNYHFIFNTPEDKTVPIGLTYMKRMLEPSKSKIYKMNKNLPDTVRYNHLLVCNHCDNYQYNTIKGWNAWQTNMEQNVLRYLKDISQAVLDNKLGKDSRYVQEVPGMIRQRSEYQINCSKNNIDGEVLSKIFEENRIPYRFERYENVPCCYCKTKTITHDKKKQLKKEILNTSSLIELRNIAEINFENIHPKYKPIIKFYEFLLRKNPDISEQKILSEIQIKSKYNIKKEFERLKSSIQKEMKQQNLNIFDKYLLKDFFNQSENALVKSSHDKYLSVEFYSKIMDKTINQMQNPIKEKFKFIATEKMKQLLLIDSVLVPPKSALKDNITPMKVVFENIFSRSTITGDHALAKSTGGASTEENIIGCCRHCNKEKDNLTINEFANVHPIIRENIPYHLKYIRNLMQQEGMSDSAIYPRKLADNIKKITRGKINPSNDLK